MIVDAFLYAGETDMLELRLRTLADHVDQHVAVMSSLTHQGQPAPIDEWDSWLDACLDRMGLPLPGEEGSRLTAHVYAPDPYPDGARGGVGSPLYQQIEKQHRDSVLEAITRTLDAELLADLNPTVLVSDVDEIPDPDSLDDLETLLEVAAPPTGWLVLEQRFHSGYLDWLGPYQPWLGTCAARWSRLRPQAMRDARGQRDRIGQVYEGGWHLSWLGTDAERQTKLDTFSHAELRDTYDPAAGRWAHQHANGETLYPMTAGDIATALWPAPILDGSFLPPQPWLEDRYRWAAGITIAADIDRGIRDPGPEARVNDELEVAVPVVQPPGQIPGHLTWDRPVTIIDNTANLSWLRTCNSHGWEHVSIGCNLGVAPSWNLAAALARTRARRPRYLALISSSVEWDQGLTQVDKLVDAAADPTRGLLLEPLAFHGTVWALELLDRVGPFDENFWPGYHEDNDWVWRLDCAGEHTAADPIPKAEVDARCANAATLLSGAIVRPDFGWQLRYYAAKWGGPPGQEVWCNPFALNVPAGWWPVLREVPRWAGRTSRRKDLR